MSKKAGNRRSAPAGGTLQEKLTTFRLLDAPGHLLRRAHQRSYEIYTKHVGQDGPTRQQFALLLTVYRNPGATQNRISQETGLDKNTLKEMFGRLIQKGLVERQRSPADNRAWQFHVTPAAVILLADVMPKVTAVQDEILSPIPPELRGVFRYCLRLLIEDTLPRGRDAGRDGKAGVTGKETSRNARPAARPLH